MNSVATIAFILVLLLLVAAPFSALSALMLLVAGFLIYGLLAALVRAFLTGDGTDMSNRPSR
jgi:hypothetical protein